MEPLKLAGRYEITRELGRGGMGIVYLARDPILDRMVAIKTLRSQKLDAESQERFDREARAIAKMDHPGIVQIFDIGRTEEGSYFVMSFVDGQSLREHIEASDLEVYELLELGSQVAEALAFSHSKGIVHRDIKPENIMVFGEKGKRRAKLMDFGISLANKDSRLTDANSIFGTLVYLPPESILSRPIGPGSDIYSLGAVLYEALTGQLPFDGDPNSILMKIVNAEPKGIRSLNPKVDALTEALVLNCLAKTALARPRSAGALAAALNEHATELREGKPPGSAERESERREMVGRKDAWLDLTLSLRRALNGVAHLALIEGDTGFGKSTLLSELSRFARGRGATVLSGRCVERSDPSSPFQAFGDALSEFLRGVCLDPEVRPTEVLGDLLPGLSRLFPQIAIPEGAPAAQISSNEGPPSGAAALDLIANAVGRIADVTPLVLFLEDLDQADVSIQALHYIFRRRPAAKLFLVGTYALGEMDKDHALHKLLKALGGERRVTRIALTPLSEVETGELMEHLTTAELPPEAVHAVHDLSGGNPLFVVDLVNSLIETDQLKDVSGLGTKIDMPDSLRRLCEDRIGALSDPDRAVLVTAAVLGSVFNPDVLCELDPATGVEDRIDSLIARRIFREEGETSQARIAFCSTLFRDVVYRGIPPLKRRGLHRRVADQLKLRTKRPDKAAAQLYEHLNAANDPTAAAPFAVVAARTALAAGSHEDAFRFARCAVEAVRDDRYAGEASVAGEAMLVWASCSEALGDVSGALDRSRIAAEEFDTAETGVLRLEAIKVGAEIAISHLRLDEARATAMLGQREARAGGERLMEREFTQSLERIEILREGGAPVITGSVPLATRSAQDLVEAEYLAAEEEYSRAAGLKDSTAVACALLPLSDLARRLGRHQTGLGFIAAAQSLISDKDALELAHLLSAQGSTFLALGRLQEAVEACEKGLQAMSSLPSEARGAFAPTFPVHQRLVEALAEALIAMGRGRDAGPLLEKESGLRAEDKSVGPGRLLVELQLHLALSNLPQAEETLKRIDGFADLSVPTAARACALSARLSLYTGRADRAQSDAERGLTLIEDYHDTDLHASLRLALGQALLAQEQASAAEEAFLFANRAAELSEARLLTVDAQLGLSSTHVARGRFLAAEVAARIAGRFALDAGARPRDIESHKVLAEAYAAAENLHGAEKELEAARALALALDLATTVIDCDLALAAIARRMGRHEVARRLAFDANKNAADLGDMSRLCRATMELGAVERVLSHFEQARTELERALTTSLMAGSEALSARIHLEYGGCLLDAGDSASARREAEAIGQAGGEGGVPASLGLDALLLKVECDVADGPAMVGLSSIQGKLAVATDPLSRARMLIRAADAVAGSSREQALSWLGQARETTEIAEAYGIAALAHGGISEIRFREGDLNEALVQARQENEWLSRSGNAAGVVRNRIRMAHCYLRTGDCEQALGWLGQSELIDLEPALAFERAYMACGIHMVAGRLAQAVEELAHLLSLAEKVQPFGPLRAQFARAALAQQLEGSTTDTSSVRSALDLVRRPFHDFVRLATLQADVLDARISLRRGGAEPALVLASSARDGLQSLGRLVQAAEADLVAIEALAWEDPGRALSACVSVNEFASANSLNVLLAEALLLTARIQRTPRSVSEGLEMARLIGSPWIVARLASIGLDCEPANQEWIDLKNQSLGSLGAHTTPVVQAEIAAAVCAGAASFGAPRPTEV
ncbi:MAG: protein kinase [Vicinamibacteria bacterium]